MRKISIFLSTILFLGIAPGFAQEESITVTTYYPAPYGVYNELETSGNTYLATDSGNVGIGTMSPTAKLHVTGGDINVDNNKVVSLAEPSENSPASDLVTKNYVDVLITGLQAQIEALEAQIGQ